MTAPHIVILGAGFAALTAVRELRRRSPDARISLIAPKAEFVYLPSLIWIPTGLRQGKDLILPLDNFLRDHGVEFVAGRVTGLENGGRTVVTDQGKLANDALVIATGGRFIKKLPGIEHALTLCEGVASAEAIRERLETFIVADDVVVEACRPRTWSHLIGGDKAATMPRGQPQHEVRERQVGQQRPVRYKSAKMRNLGLG